MSAAPRMILEGVPVFHSPGGRLAIVCTETYGLVVTLSCDREPNGVGHGWRWEHPARTSMAARMMFRRLRRETGDPIFGRKVGRMIGWDVLDPGARKWRHFTLED